MICIALRTMHGHVTLAALISCAVSCVQGEKGQKGEEVVGEDGPEGEQGEMVSTLSGVCVVHAMNGVLISFLTG